ncbi:hypothetical protein EST38_g9630 [Candolleomyces aberdarensis]|uniref:Uncharacterized protein n=1 Tax=Candolleomyces aberdarensis TaxID=2316362 RepID=A0A4Q2DBS9_9AGAR|nr:hypothetical protein EST38_g9630 [Candolleomyces aberdarensis]
MFTIPIFALLIVNERKAIPSPEPLHHYGYTCNFEKGNYVYNFLVACLTFGGVACAYMPALTINDLIFLQWRPTPVIMTLGMITLVVLYRSQNGSLITVIRRDGGIYMVVTFSLWLAEAIFSIPGFPIEDTYGVIFIPLVANQLILDVKRVAKTTQKEAQAEIEDQSGWNLEEGQNV